MRTADHFPTEFHNVAAASPTETANWSTKAAASFSLRLSFEERARLQRDAGNLPLGAYIRACLFGGDASPRRARRQPGLDHTILARVLGQLGDSRLANNVNQLAKAANMGSLPVDEETEHTSQVACAAIARMRADLVRAMGLRE